MRSISSWSWKSLLDRRLTPEWQLGLFSSRACRIEIHPNLNCCSGMNYLASFQRQVNAKSIFEVVKIDFGNFLDSLQSIRQAVSM